MDGQEARQLAKGIAAGLISREASDAGAWADDMPDKDVFQIQEALEALAWDLTTTPTHPQVKD